MGLGFSSQGGGRVGVRHDPVLWRLLLQTHTHIRPHPVPSHRADGDQRGAPGPGRWSGLRREVRLLLRRQVAPQVPGKEVPGGAEGHLACPGSQAQPGWV